LTFMQSVGAWRMLGECSTRCHLGMWSPLLLWYRDMWNVAKGRRPWNYFDKCKRRMCNQTLLLLWGCWIRVPAWSHLKRASSAGVLMSRSFTGAWSRMFLWGSSLVDMHAQCGSMEDAWSEYSISGSTVSNTLHKDSGQASSNHGLASS